MIPPDVLKKLNAVMRRIELAAAFDGIGCDDFNQATSVKKLAEIAGMSERSLRDYFKLHTGCRIVDYASTRRAEYAARLLRHFPALNNSAVAQILGFTTRTGLHNLLRKNGVIGPSSLRESSVPIDEPVPYRIEPNRQFHLFFKLDNLDYDECNSPEFEKSSWDSIEDFVKNRWPELRLNSYVGFAIDRYLAGNQDEGIFLSGILYDCTGALNFPGDLHGDFGYHKLPAQTYAIFTHKGSYDSLNQFYQQVFATLNQAKGIEVNPQFPFMERYLNSPSETVESELVTEILVAITSPTKCSA